VSNPTTAPPLDARPTGDHLLASILAAPDDDAPRLVYADWLDERGEPGDADYAAFIRCQIELARVPVCDSDPPCKLLNKGIPEEAQGWCLNCCHHGKRRDELLGRERELWGSYPDSTMREVIRRECPSLESWNVLPGTWCQPGHYTGTPVAVVRRGFVDEIRLACGSFVGGPCGRCNGDGQAHGADRPFEWSADVDYGKCVVCRGTGRTPGLAALAGRQPVTGVVLTDREPRHIAGAIQSGWTWSKHDTGERDDVPQLWDLIDCPSYTDGWFKYFPTRADAHAALAAAALAYLRASSRDRARSAAQNPA
jgi:uncharacterized protein (TIGR02996 family)